MSALVDALSKLIYTISLFFSWKYVMWPKDLVSFIFNSSVWESAPNMFIYFNVTTIKIQPPGLKLAYVTM